MIKPKPKRAPRARKTTTMAKSDDSDFDVPTDVSVRTGPTYMTLPQDLESLSDSPPIRGLRSTRSSITPGRIIHKQSAERDLPVPLPRKSGKVAPRDLGEGTSSCQFKRPRKKLTVTASTMSTTAPFKAASSSKKAGSSAKRRAPTPDPFSTPSKPAKVPKTRAKAARA